MHQLADYRERLWELSRTDGHVFRCDLEFTRGWTAWILLNDEPLGGQSFDRQEAAAEWGDEVLIRLGGSVPSSN
jgi:hypothetical protein